MPSVLPCAIRCGMNCVSKKAFAEALVGAFRSWAARQAAARSLTGTLHCDAELPLALFAVRATASHDLRNVLNAATWSSASQPGSSPNVTRSSFASGGVGAAGLAAVGGGLASLLI